jgi:DNA-binding LacI/PurR family transcriptional regulator
MCSHLWLYDGIERNFDTISIRVYDAVYSATSYLISKGYKKIAYLAGKRGIEVYRQRYEAYRQALSDGGIPYNDDLVYWNSYDESGGYAGGKHFFSKGIFPEALCASNDLQMIGFYRACQECPKEQARHIEFVGVDNLEISELLNFSSVDIHEAEVGKNATELLFLRMNEGFEKLPPQDVFINPKLVIRTHKVF